LVILKPGRVLQNFHQGSVINFIEDDTEVKYVVTWKRVRTRTHTLIEVVAFTADQRVIEPYAVAWPSLVMLVPHIQNKAPSSPELRQYGHQLNREQWEMELELADEAWKDTVWNTIWYRKITYQVLPCFPQLINGAPSIIEKTSSITIPI